MVNSVMLIGILNEPKEAIRYNKTQVTLTLHVVERSLGKTTEAYFPCVATDRPAELMAGRIEKGKKIAIEGRLRNRTAKSENGDRYQQTYIEITDFVLI